MSWSFADGQHLAVSVETRKTKDQEYSTLAGFFRQYELIYVAADERDVVALRTNFRGEEVYLYRLGTTQQAARILLLDYLDAINALAREPRWYKRAPDELHHRHPPARDPRRWKGAAVMEAARERLPARAALRARLHRHQPAFAELKAISRINDRARAAGAAEDFSTRIRAGLPLRGCRIEHGAGPARLEIHPRPPRLARHLVQRRAADVGHLAHARARQQGFGRVVAVLVAHEPQVDYRELRRDRLA